MTDEQTSMDTVGQTALFSDNVYVLTESFLSKARPAEEELLESKKVPRLKHDFIQKETSLPQVNSSPKEPSSPEEVLAYVAHYSSPANAAPTKGFFEFESIFRASSKQNHHDARVRMLEIFGKDAVSWVIDGIKLKKKNNRVCSDQLELDFRSPKPIRKRPRPKKYL